MVLELSGQSQTTDRGCFSIQDREIDTAGTHSPFERRGRGDFDAVDAHWWVVARRDRFTHICPGAPVVAVDRDLEFLVAITVHGCRHTRRC